MVHGLSCDGCMWRRKRSGEARWGSRGIIVAAGSELGRVWTGVTCETDGFGKVPSGRSVGLFSSPYSLNDHNGRLSRGHSLFVRKSYYICEGQFCCTCLMEGKRCYKSLYLWVFSEVILVHWHVGGGDLELELYMVRITWFSKVDYEWGIWFVLRRSTGCSMFVEVETSAFLASLSFFGHHQGPF